MSLMQKIFEGETFAKASVVKSATGAVGLHEQFCIVGAATAPITLTLPSVAEAAGRSYYFYCPSTTYAVKITHAGDSRKFRSAGQLDAAEEWCKFTSTGANWILESGPSVRRRYMYEEFFNSPVVYRPSGAALAQTTGTNMMMFPHTGNVFDLNLKGTQTITGPIVEATGARGLDMTLDEAAADDGWELTNGILARQPMSFLVGRDACYLKVNFYIEDVSGTDDCAVGFRKAEAYQANIDDYADMAVLNAISGGIWIETMVGGAATTSTNTTNTWADLATKTLEVYVSSAGVVTYMITGVAPTVTAAFTFTDGLTIIPFMFFLQNTDLTKLHINSWECGLL